MNESHLSIYHRPYVCLLNIDIFGLLILHARLHKSGSDRLILGEQNNRRSEGAGYARFHISLRVYWPIETCEQLNEGDVYLLVQLLVRASISAERS